MKPDTENQPAPPVESAADKASEVSADPSVDLSAKRPGGTVMRGLGTALAVVGLIGVGFLWQKIAGMQEQLAQQSARSLALATEAKTLAAQAQTLVQDSTARVALQEARVAELSLQRSQFDELMRSLARSRDENLVVEIEANLRLAQQQAQLTGSVAPLITALRNADQRIVRAAQPTLAPLQRSIARDLERIKTVALSDTPALMGKVEDLIRRVDQLELANAVATKPTRGTGPAAAPALTGSAWTSWLASSWSELKALVRVSRIEDPEAVLLTPEQGFFLRENLKLKLMGVRMALLSRQPDQARSEVDEATELVRRNFDSRSDFGKATLALLRMVHNQLGQLEVPRIDQTLTVLAGATAGR